MIRWRQPSSSREGDVVTEDLILTMRFNTARPLRHARVYMSQTDIAKLLGERKDKVDRICTQALKFYCGKKILIIKSSSKIIPLHKVYLTKSYHHLKSSML